MVIPMVTQKVLPVGSMTKEREPSTIVPAEQFNTMTTQPIVNSAAESNTGPGKIKIRSKFLFHSYPFLFFLSIVY